VPDSVPGAVPGAGVAGYSHVAVDVTDLEAAKDFYTRIFGFRELRRPDFGFPGAWLQVGDLQLHLAVVDGPVQRGGFPHFALYVPTADFDATMAALRGAGVEFMGEPSARVDFGETTVLAAFVRDPSGNVIELTDVGPAT
jgi:catechol 2,3-dioxygenase-like lactoylglutathione lyase family enzyme